MLINIASTAAYQPTPGQAVYGAFKAFVLSLTEALAHETWDSGLRVLALSPGPTRIESFDVVGTEDAAVGRFQTATQVVSLALAELDRAHPRPSVVSGLTNTATAILARLLPRRITLNAAGRALRYLTPSRVDGCSGGSVTGPGTRPPSSDRQTARPPAAAGPSA